MVIGPTLFVNFVNGRRRSYCFYVDNAKTFTSPEIKQFSKTLVSSYWGRGDFIFSKSERLPARCGHPTHAKGSHRRLANDFENRERPLVYTLSLYDIRHPYSEPVMTFSSHMLALHLAKSFAVTPSRFNDTRSQWEALSGLEVLWQPPNRLTFTPTSSIFLLPDVSE